MTGVVERCQDVHCASKLFITAGRRFADAGFSVSLGDAVANAGFSSSLCDAVELVSVAGRMFAVAALATPSEEAASVSGSSGRRRSQ